MKYYLLETVVAYNENGGLTLTDTILTKPTDHRATMEGQRRFKRLGIETAVVKKDKNYKKIMAAQNKRRLAARALTIGEVAEIIAQS
jgi:hypothetical protein